MKIASIVLALGAVVASVHASLPGVDSLPVAPLLANLVNPPAAQDASANSAYKRNLPLPADVTTGTAADDFIDHATAASMGLVPADLFGKRALPLPVNLETGTVADSLMEKATAAATSVAPPVLRVKRDAHVDVDITAQVKAAADVHIAAVAKAVVEIKADLVAQIKRALKIDANIEITAAIEAQIIGIVLFFISSCKEELLCTNTYLCLTYYYLYKKVSLTSLLTASLMSTLGLLPISWPRSRPSSKLTFPLTPISNLMSTSLSTILLFSSRLKSTL